MWGIMGSNYAGVSNIDLNPSTMVTSKLGWDFNIMTFDANLSNNSFYTNPQFVFATLLKPQITFSTTKKDDQEKVQSANVVLRDNIQKSTYLTANAIIKGPSFMYTNGREAFAITTAFRSGVSTFGISQSAARLGFENLNYDPLMNQSLTLEKGTAAAAMAWLEIGGSYARRISESERYLFTGGVSAKLLIGYAGGHALIKNADYTVPYKGNFTANSLSFDYSHAVNADKKPVSLFNPLGAGASMDIGVTIMKKKKGRNNYYGCPVLTRKKSAFSGNINYKWKLGLSLIDLGGINFAKNTVAYSYSNVSYSWDSIAKTKSKTLAQADKEIYDKYASNGNVTLKNSIFIWTPTAISAQFDYNVNDLFYVNASIIQRLVIASQARLARMNSIAITPRYETSGLEVAIPIIVNEYLYPGMGMMVRYKSFFIGTDQLGSTFGITALYGLDLYLGIKISNFGKNKEPKVRY